MREEKWIRERLVDLRQQTNGATNEWTKEHLRTGIYELELVLEDVR